MDSEITALHPEFRLNGIACDTDGLKEIGYSLIKEGDEYERHIGDFLTDWLSYEETVQVNTSGSTGIPKTISLKKTSMVHSARATGAYLKLDENSKALLCLSATNIAGKMMMVRAMTLGWHLDFVRPSKNPLRGLTKSYDFCAMTPMQLLASLEELNTVRLLIVGGASVNEGLKTKLREKQTGIFESYGMTETASHIALKPVNEAAVNFIGIPDDRFEAMPDIALSKDQRDCLVIEAKYLSDKPIITNDLVELMDQDKFRWLGRWDHVVNSGGIKLIPEQIEKKMKAFANNRFVLLGQADASLGERLVMVVEGELNKNSFFDSLKNSGEFHPYEIPKEIFTIERIPETSNGKIRRAEIASLISSGTL